jgi:hypothetical protein
LRESEISLHILSEDGFNIKKVLGVDRIKAYARKDQTKLSGDEKLRKQVTSIRNLGQCASLAYDTDGSIFSSKIQNKKNDSDMKIIGNIFAKRIAQSSKQKPCYLCECEGHNSGSAYLSCSSCDDGSNSEYDIDETFDTDNNSYEDV